MQKQKNSINERDLLNRLKHIKLLALHKTLKPCPAYRAMERLFWLQNEVMDEAYNFYAFTSVINGHHVVDMTKPFTGNPPASARYSIYHGTKNQRVLKEHDVITLVNEIMVKITQLNKDKYAKYMYN